MYTMCNIHVSLHRFGHAQTAFFQLHINYIPSVIRLINHTNNIFYTYRVFLRKS